MTDDAFALTMRCIKLYETTYGKYNFANIMYKSGLPCHVQQPQQNTYVTFDDIVSLCNVDYNKFVIVEKIFLDTSYDNEIIREQKIILLDKKIERLTNIITELEERIACIPFGQKI